MAAGEGIETMLSLRSVVPTVPMVAALSANHLAAILFPPTLRRLYVARDDDPAGDAAMATLIERARAAGIEALTLSPTLGDFNEDLRHLGIDDLRAALRTQLAPEDLARFMESAMEAETAGSIRALGALDRAGSRVIPSLPERRPRPSERAIGRQADRDRNGGPRLFSAAG